MGLLRVKLPTPDHEYGYTSATLRNAFGEDLWSKFTAWHADSYGPAWRCDGLPAADDTGTYYLSDVRQFLEVAR